MRIRKILDIDSEQLMLATGLVGVIGGSIRDEIQKEVVPLPKENSITKRVRANPDAAYTDGGVLALLEAVRAKTLGADFYIGDKKYFPQDLQNEIHKVWKFAFNSPKTAAGVLVLLGVFKAHGDGWYRYIAVPRQLTEIELRRAYKNRPGELVNLGK